MRVLVTCGATWVPIDDVRVGDELVAVDDSQVTHLPDGVSTADQSLASCMVSLWRAQDGSGARWPRPGQRVYQDAPGCKGGPLGGGPRAERFASIKHRVGMAAGGDKRCGDPL